MASENTSPSVELNVDALIGQVIATYEGQRGGGFRLGDADAERLILDVMAYREVILRALIQRLSEQNFVQTASGQYLDRWGQLFGALRRPGETDGEYRQRLDLSGEAHESVGTRGAYTRQIKALEEVADVWLETKRNDPALPPGHIRIWPLMEVREKTPDGQNIAKGAAIDSDDAQQTGPIAAVMTDPEFALIGERFDIMRVSPAPLGVEVSLTLITSTDKAAAELAIKNLIRQEVGRKSLMMWSENDLSSSDFNLAKIGETLKTQIKGLSVGGREITQEAVRLTIAPLGAPSQKPINYYAIEADSISVIFNNP